MDGYAGLLLNSSLLHSPFGVPRRGERCLTGLRRDGSPEGLGDSPAEREGRAVDGILPTLLLDELWGIRQGNEIALVQTCIA